MRLIFQFAPSSMQVYGFNETLLEVLEQLTTFPVDTSSYFEAFAMDEPELNFEIVNAMH